VAREKSSRQWLWWSISVVLLIGGFLNDPPWKWYSPEQRFTMYGESYRITLSLLHDGTFANPFWSLPTGATGHMAPAYPYAQFLLLKMFGEASGGWLAVRVFATLAQSLQFALLPWVARSFGFSMWTGFLAAVFGIWVKVPREELSESHFAGLVMLLLAWAMTRPGVRAAVVAGFAFLTQPVAALVYFPWAAWQRQRWLLIGVPLLICAPWLARTWAATGGPAWIRSNLGLEMYVSFNDCVPYGIRGSERVTCFPALHPNIQGAEAAKLRDLGEFRYNRARLGDALSWMAAHPTRTASLIGQRIWYYWFPSDAGWEGYVEQRKRFATLHLLTVLSFVGLGLMWRRRMPHASLMTLWIGLYPAIYYLEQFEGRYRYSGLWITYLLAAFAVQVLVEKSRKAAPRATIEVSTHVAF
jgi:hypothetical protein